jgi:hypothetical protein
MKIAFGFTDLLNGHLLPLEKKAFLNDMRDSNHFVTAKANSTNNLEVV